MMTSTLFDLGSIRMAATVLLLGLALRPMAAHGQGGAITADPNAQQLRPIWRAHRGPLVGGERVGIGAGGLGDIYGTGKGAWAVHDGAMQEWRIFRNRSDDIARDTIPVRTFKLFDVPSDPLVVGDFWGTGHKAIGFGRRVVVSKDPFSEYYYELHLFRTDGNTIADSESAVLNTRSMTPPRQMSQPDTILVADLDGDAIDELIILHGEAFGPGIDDYPELWIYKGGPGFQVDSPTVIVRGPVNNGAAIMHAAAGDFDGDHRADLVLSRSYKPPTSGKDNYIMFYWGTGDLSTFGGGGNTRIIMLDPEHPDASWGITGLDCDGDRQMDLAVDRTYNGEKGAYLYRSGGGKNARTRSYRMDDADITFPGLVALRRGGFINNSARRCEMLIIGRPENDGSGLPSLMLFSGGPHGPDRAYDAYNTTDLGQVAMHDVDGDGWDDLMGYDPSEDNDGGIAVIYAGGPYIPSSKSSGVEAIAGDGHMQAMTVWPNPMHDELHIAWRGDLGRMPSRFAVHDLLGSQIASGEVEPWRGAALWQCEDAASGVYILSIYDANNAVIATRRISKQ